MASSFFLYAATFLTLVGSVSIAVPLRWLGIRNRGVAFGVLLTGFVTAQVILSWPARSVVVKTPVTALDTFAPEYQFFEHHAIPIRATPAQVYNALKSVTAAEIPLYQELAWVRRGGKTTSENILNPPDHVPLFTVATRTSFITLADEPGREYVMGTVVIAPPGVRLALGSSPDSFKDLTQPGFAKATIGFRIEPYKPGWSILRTETRVAATDYVSRATFARYWRVIAPGSAFIRKMWLRTVKVRAEHVAAEGR
jgi:hypothetical protein